MQNISLIRNPLFYILFLLSVSEISGYCITDSLLITFWNLENFFDYIDDGKSDSDKEWSSYGSRHWNKKKFYTKCDAVAKSLLWIGDEYGKMPDIIGLAEIENRGVLYKLLRNTILRKYDYDVIHYDSSDKRGIDVALLYRSNELKQISYSLKVPEYKGRRLDTRDILQVCFQDEKGRKINVIVNHHPSKYGGAEISSGKRYAAMEALRRLCDSLKISDKGIPIVAMGDFNDTPDGKQFTLLDSILVNKSDSLFINGKGTIRYEGKWELIDMFMVSPEIAQFSEMEILQVPFLMTYEKKYPGMKPLRTYSGPRYIGGVSDHCPIILLFKIRF